MAKSKKVSYSEPKNYFPKAILKKYGLGEYNKDADGEKKTTAKKKTKKK